MKNTMKKMALGLLALAFCWVAPTQACSKTPAHADLADRLIDGLAIELAVAHIQAGVAAEMDAFNIINWKVGEMANYKMTSLFGELGTMVKRVDREEENAIWVISETSGQMGNNKIEMLLDRATGKVLQYIENGSSKAPPSNDDMEIIDQIEERITVPAGTFDTIKITAKTPQIKKLEAWFNPSKTVMDGQIQAKINTGFLPVTMQLTSFTR